MNHGDVFVVDTGSKIFVWAGAESSGHERMAAGMVASRWDIHSKEILHPPSNKPGRATAQHPTNVGG